MGKQKNESKKSKAKGYQDIRQPEIIALDTYFKQSGSVSIQHACNILREQYGLGEGYTDNVFYQRILKLRSNEYKEATPKELSAITRFLHVEANPHLYGSIIHNLGEIERKTAQIEKYLLSGYQNKTETAKRIKELKSLNKLSISNIQPNQE